MNPVPDPRAIRELAYRLWEERGRPDESAEDIWLEAERQLRHVHEDFTSSEVPTLNASAMARAETVAAADPGSRPQDTAAQDPGLDAGEYSPEKPPVNAEFKWAAAELQKPARARAPRNQRR